ncbi:carbohydrate-binding module family 21 protein [Tortispora caseinolytica NRRL Y-17796]|uniref:Carbohydrate-binding module family 21 protein n=1 Tax=Tortispora caseinolytica NRRL Y-17796 TaxID=767744 RepID=A0A1E4TI60_9ASCO|nr:carbohydrate-binding module family 21 protein [Tortispora caseinolytica NRRL Y-17796]
MPYSSPAKNTCSFEATSPSFSKDAYSNANTDISAHRNSLTDLNVIFRRLSPRRASVSETDPQLSLAESPDASEFCASGNLTHHVSEHNHSCQPLSIPCKTPFTDFSPTSDQSSAESSPLSNTSNTQFLDALDPITALSIGSASTPLSKDSEIENSKSFPGSGEPRHVTAISSSFDSSTFQHRSLANTQVPSGNHSFTASQEESSLSLDPPAEDFSSSKGSLYPTVSTASSIPRPRNLADSLTPCNLSASPSSNSPTSICPVFSDSGPTDQTLPVMSQLSTALPQRSESSLASAPYTSRRHRRSSDNPIHGNSFSVTNIREAIASSTSPTITESTTCTALPDTQISAPHPPPTTLSTSSAGQTADSLPELSLHEQSSPFFSAPMISYKHGEHNISSNSSDSSANSVDTEDSLTYDPTLSPAVSPDLTGLQKLHDAIKSMPHMSKLQSGSPEHSRKSSFQANYPLTSSKIEHVKPARAPIEMSDKTTKVYPEPESEPESETETLHDSSSGATLTRSQSALDLDQNDDTIGGYPLHRTESAPHIIRKKSGELVRPSLKSNSRPVSVPSTPTFPKNVHFDPTLVHVRHFLNSEKPNAVSADSSPVREKDESELWADAPSMDDENYEAEEEDDFFTSPRFPRFRRTSATYRPTRNSAYSPRRRRSSLARLTILTPNWPSESQQMDKRCTANVFMEKVYLSNDKKNLIGHVAVRNIAFAKTVVAKFTFDYWKTISEVYAHYNADIRDRNFTDSFDRFTFIIALDGIKQLTSKSLFFCIRYSAGGNEFWDNNDCLNYEVDFRPSGPKSSNVPDSDYEYSDGASVVMSDDDNSSVVSVPGRRVAGLRTILHAPSTDNLFNARGKVEDIPRKMPEETCSTLDGLKKSSGHSSGDDIDKTLGRTRESNLNSRYSFGNSLKRTLGLGTDSNYALDSDNAASAPRSNYSLAEMPGAEVGQNSKFKSSKPAALPDKVREKVAHLTKMSRSGIPDISANSYKDLIDSFCFFQTPSSTNSDTQFAGSSLPKDSLESLHNSLGNFSIDDSDVTVTDTVSSDSGSSSKGLKDAEAVFDVSSPMGLSSSASNGSSDDDLLLSKGGNGTSSSNRSSQATYQKTMQTTA